MEPETINAIRIRAIIEVLGKPKEHVEESLKLYIDNMKEDKDLVVLKEDYSDIKEKENLWLKFVEMELVVKGIPTLFNFCFTYMPSSIEILKPGKFSIEQREMSGFLNDLQGRLHTVDMIVKQLKTENQFIKRNMNGVLTNNIVLLLKLRELDIGQLSDLTGVQKEELQEFVNILVKDNKLKKEGELYSLIPHVKG